MTRQKKSAILAADLGNTTLTLGLYQNGRIRGRAAFPHTRIRDHLLCEALEGLIGSVTIEGIAFASVAPAHDRRFEKVLRAAVNAPFLRVDHTCDFGMKLSYSKPETLGVDRLLNAAWVSSRYGSPAIVCDIGTAVTVDLVLPGRGFVGGVILPGPAVMLNYLAERTGKLPVITLKGGVRRACGRSTEEAMRIGVQRGFSGMVGAVVDAMRKEHPDLVCPLYVGGGYARELHLPSAWKPVLDLNMTLCGLGGVFERMRAKEDAGLPEPAHKSEKRR